MSSTKILSTLEEWEKPPFGNIQLTENQRKVITDKYLRNDPSVEYWLWNVAKNVALSELFYTTEFRQHVFDNVSVDREIYDVGGNEKTELLLFHKNFSTYDDWNKNHRQLMRNMYELCEQNESARTLVLKAAKEYYEALANFDFLPNSPTLMNASRDLQQLSACYVLPIEDSIEGWGDVVKHTMIIHKSGGGTGFSACRVRPRGSNVKSTSGIASGAISPFSIINHATENVKQGGTRRGANMGILPYWHPDILNFISYKAEEGKLDNFNISVGADAKFMQAVKDDKDYELINPHTKEVVGTMRAQEVFDKICENAWKSGDPGMIWIDSINNSRSNTTPHMGQIESTNPCGEQPLLPYEPCNLASINLSKFVVRGEVDWERLGQVTHTAIKFLDSVIDVNNYPLPQIEYMAKGNRRIGLGVMGWGEMLILLGISYRSPEAIAKAGEVMEFINQKSLEASEARAKERGVFAFFKNSGYDKEGKYPQDFAVGRPRNCARTTIAPTGTIAIAAGLQGSGIEPFFAIAYTRYNAKALDALKKGQEPAQGDVFHEVNPLFRRVAEQNNYWGLQPNELWKKIEDNHSSVKGVPEIPDDVQKLFISAHDVEVDFHVQIQSQFQKHIDNGVSKTINMNNDATVEDIKKTYLAAWEANCKGITVFRDGCKSQQVLNLQEKKAQEEEEEIDLRDGMSSKYYKFDTGYGPIHIHIDHNEKKIYRVFTSTTPVGTEIAGLVTSVGILLSKYLEQGGSVEEVRKHLNSIKSDRPHGFGPNKIESIPHAISVALTKFLSQQHALPGQQTLTSVTEPKTNGKAATNGAAAQEKPDPHKEQHCPKCYSPNIAFQSGCTGPTCFDCGFSECS